MTSLPGTYHNYVNQRELFLETARKAEWKVTVITGGYHTITRTGAKSKSKGKTIPKGDTKESQARYDRVMKEIAAQKPLVDVLKTKNYARGYDAIVYNFSCQSRWGLLCALPSGSSTNV